MCAASPMVDDLLAMANDEITTVIPGSFFVDASSIKGKKVSDAASLDQESLYKAVVKALGDADAKTRGGGQGVALHMEAQFIMSKIHHYLDTDGDGESDADRADRTAASMAIVMGGVANRLGDVEVAKQTVNRIAALLACPSLDVQTACAVGIGRAIKALPAEEGAETLNHYLKGLGTEDAATIAFGIAGVVKGLTSKSLCSHGVLDRLDQAVNDKKDAKKRETALRTYQALSLVLKNVFEPYAGVVLPQVIAKLGDKVAPVKVAAEDAWKSFTSLLSNYSLYAVMPIIGRALSDSASTSWQARVLCLNLVESKVVSARRQVTSISQRIVPSVIESLSDTKAEVQTAAKSALTTIGNELITSPEMKAMVDPIVSAIISPGDMTNPCVERLMDVTFMNPIDRPCLALMVPVLRRGLTEKRNEDKRRALLVVGNMCGLVIDGKELIPYVPAIMPDLVACVRDSSPEMRHYGATALAAFLKGMAAEHLEQRFENLADELQKLQKEIVSTDDSVKTAAERKLQELIDLASDQATKTHHTEEEVKADLERLRLEEEEKQRQEAEAAEAAKQMEIEEESRAEVSEYALRKKAIAEEEKRKEEERKELEKQAREDAKKQAEADKLRAFKKFQEEQKAAMLKHQRAKKKK